MAGTTDELAIGIDFGGTKMLGAVVDSGGRVLAERRTPTPYDGSALLDAMFRLVTSLEADLARPATGVGVGAAGLVDREGVLTFGPNVGRITDVSILAGLRQRLPGYVVRVDNDATCATWAEFLLGAGRNVQEMVQVTLGTGIGGGIVTGGKLCLGWNGFAGEPGHMTIVARGVECICGKLGCWEAYCSGRALGRMGREAVAKGQANLLTSSGAIEDIRGEHVTEAARRGDAGSISIMEEFAWWLAVGVSNLVALMDPQRIVLGGGLSEHADLYLEQANRFLAEIVHGSGNRPDVEMVVGSMGERSGAVGAALLVHGEDIRQ